MIFLGDIASPNAACSADLKSFFESHSSIFSQQVAVANLEGLICDSISPNSDTPVLYNHSSVFEALAAGNIKGVGLANNHTLDLPGFFETSLHQLQQHKIAYAGAGFSMADAEAPMQLEADGEQVIIFNSCWDFLLYHQKNPTGKIQVAEFDIHKLLDDISNAKKQKPAVKVAVYLHWSFDLETVPFPMYRQMGQAMIDAGANIVIGTHSHCVQGGEAYKDGYIVYGLGNFFLPNACYANGKLIFPAMSSIELAIEWNASTGKVVCHWFTYEVQAGHHVLIHQETSDFNQSPLLKKYSPYTGLGQQEFLVYYKTNRRKKMLIPVYSDYNARLKNNFYTWWLKSRARIARTLARYNFIKWQS